MNTQRPRRRPPASAWRRRTAPGSGLPAAARTGPAAATRTIAPGDVAAVQRQQRQQVEQEQRQVQLGQQLSRNADLVHRPRCPWRRAPRRRCRPDADDADRAVRVARLALAKIAANRRRDPGWGSGRACPATGRPPSRTYAGSCRDRPSAANCRRRAARRGTPAVSVELPVWSVPTVLAIGRTVSVPALAVALHGQRQRPAGAVADRVGTVVQLVTPVGSTGGRPRATIVSPGRRPACAAGRRPAWRRSRGRQVARGRGRGEHARRRPGDRRAVDVRARCRSARSRRTAPRGRGSWNGPANITMTRCTGLSGRTAGRVGGQHARWRPPPRTSAMKRRIRVGRACSRRPRPAGSCRRCGCSRRAGSP